MASKTSDFLRIFADEVDGDGAVEAAQAAQAQLQAFKDMAKNAKIVVMEVFLLKALQNHAAGRSSGDDAEAQKAAGVVVCLQDV